MSTPVRPTDNYILRGLPEAERARIVPHLEMLTIDRGFEFYGADQPVEFAYFLSVGVGSIVTAMKETPIVEIATVGPEGMIGMPLLLDAGQTVHRAFMQVPGAGMRMPAAVFRDMLRECPEFSRLLHRYALALLSHVAQNAACNRTHSVEERLARWLLMTRDRMRSVSYPLTQEFIAQMLGVRRQTVSLAAGMLSRAGLIVYARGQITILDSEGLSAAACECYDIIVQEFERLVGAPG